ncbi:nuclear transport factor 2 family protein [Nodosilinea sp. LEGE 07298]|uniref:nuclear transport factor 2 family protein n=1 Tax=Nodosilinea sp. LEGE 07298 TaxID=2777970 RepID=UPI001882E596|nr:nuclear transport factor 2 family protein [Nodosilinea sp. LEGE 07298]MBE9108194.1 nuclear transport factor 2 family protein [Nodosilinea sp. LEGE 07298]
MTTQVNTEISLPAVFEDICQLVLKGSAMEAFEKYYADTVVMQENDEPATVGKEANRRREEDFFAKILDFHEAKPKNVAFTEDTIFSEWYLDYTHAEWGRRTYHQVSVQQWQGGQVIHERFYYGS